MADVFVSYSRRDAVFVRRIADSISERGKEVWLDTEGIADGEVFPEAIKRAIEQSDAFLFVITPDAVSSAYCENEVEYARDIQKRIVPVLRELGPRFGAAGGDPESQLDPVHRGRRVRPLDGAAGQRARHGSGGEQGAHALAGQGAGVGFRGPATRASCCAARS